MASSDKIQPRIAELLEELAGQPEPITASTELKALDIDSLDLAEIAQAVADEFGVQLAVDRLAGAQTVGDLMSFVARHPS